MKRFHEWIGASLRMSLPFFLFSGFAATAQTAEVVRTFQANQYDLISVPLITASNNQFVAMTTNVPNLSYVCFYDPPATNFSWPRNQEKVFGMLRLRIELFCPATVSFCVHSEMPRSPLPEPFLFHPSPTRSTRVGPCWDTPIPWMSNGRRPPCPAIFRSARGFTFGIGMSRTTRYF